MLVEGQRAIEETITSKLEGSLPSLQEDGESWSSIAIRDDHQTIYKPWCRLATEWEYPMFIHCVTVLLFFSSTYLPVLVTYSAHSSIVTVVYLLSNEQSRVCGALVFALRASWPSRNSSCRWRQPVNQAYCSYTAGHRSYYHILGHRVTLACRM